MPFSSEPSSLAPAILALVLLPLSRLCTSRPTRLQALPSHNLFLLLWLRGRCSEYDCCDDRKHRGGSGNLDTKPPPHGRVERGVVLVQVASLGRVLLPADSRCQSAFARFVRCCVDDCSRKEWRRGGSLIDVKGRSFPKARGS